MLYYNTLYSIILYYVMIIVLAQDAVFADLKDMMQDLGPDLDASSSSSSSDS